MLFVKYVSDVFQDYWDKLKEEFGDDQERIRRRLSRYRCQLPLSCLLSTNDSAVDCLTYAEQLMPQASIEKL